MAVQPILDSFPPVVCRYSARGGSRLLFSGVRRQRVRKPLLERYSGGPEAGIPKRPFGNGLRPVRTVRSRLSPASAGQTPAFLSRERHRRGVREIEGSPKAV